VGDSYSSLKPALGAVPAPRVGLYQPWLGVADEGWTRFVLDEFEFPYAVVHNAEIRAGNLSDRYDCLILPSLGASSIINGQAPDTTEPQYEGGIGPEGVVALQDFVSHGGTLVCIDGSCSLPVNNFNIPVRNVLEGKKSDEFYCPGSILRVSIDKNHPLGYGMTDWASGYFTGSQAFEVIRPDTKEVTKDDREPKKTIQDNRGRPLFRHRPARKRLDSRRGPHRRQTRHRGGRVR